MTVSNSVRKAGPFLGNGVTTAFPFTFKVFTTADITLTRTDAAGLSTTLTLGSDYSVTLNLDQDNNPGGTIIYPLVGSPLAAGLSLTAIGSLAASQGADITNAGRFLAQVVEDAFDKLTILSQQVLEKVNRALAVPVSESNTSALPIAANRANRVLAFDGLGQPLISPFTVSQLANAAAAAYFAGNIAPLAWGVGFVTGAIGAGGDDTATIQASIDALPAGWTLALPPGVFRYTTLTINRALKVRGAGKSGSGTILRSTSATLDGIVITTVAMVELSDFYMDATVTRTAGAFVKVIPASGANFDATIRRITFVAPWIGVNFVDAADFTVEDCYFVSYNNAGIQIANVAVPDNGDSLVFNNTFDGTGGALNNAAISQVSSGGLRILGNKFLSSSYHYLGQLSGETSILIFNDNSSESAGIANIALTGINPITFSKVIVSGNQFSVAGGAVGMSVTDPGYSFLDDASIGGNSFNLAAGATGLNLGRGIRVSIFPNSFIGNGAGCVGATFGVNCNATVWPQNMQNVATRYNGTLTFITFMPGGLVQSGSNADTTNIAYGTALFASSTRTITYATAYSKAPLLTLKVAGGGCVSAVVVGTPSATSFQYAAIGATNGGSVTVTWEASGG